MSDFIHVYPLNDLREHTDSCQCICNPTKIEEEGIILHNACDGREMRESLNTNYIDTIMVFDHKNGSYISIHDIKECRVNRFGNVLDITVEDK